MMHVLGGTMQYLWMGILIFFCGCDTSQRTRDTSEPIENLDATVGIQTDGARLETDIMERDAQTTLRPDGGELPPDAAVTETPTPESRCDGEDEDADGRVDEGIANACGGCGGIPPGGCQAWRINLIQNGDSDLNVHRLLGLSAGILGVSFSDIPNGTCRTLRLQNRFGPDDHMGAVEIEHEEHTLTLNPRFDVENESVGYEADADTAPWPRLSVGVPVSIRAQGGRTIGAFDTALSMPTRMDLIPADGLTQFATAIRGDDPDEPAVLSWSAVDSVDSQLRLYIGGSRIVFRRVRFYQAIEHYVLDGALVDDGEFQLPEVFQGAGVAQSSIWVYLLRHAQKRLIFGPHTVSLDLGQRVESRVPGGQIPGDTPPFQIINPSPNTREFTPGVPLAVQWSALPEGVGPLTMTLSHRNDETGIHTLVDCEIIDPSLGQATLLEDITSEVSDMPGQFRQLTLKWQLSSADLEAPDAGRFSRATSVILDFTQ